MDLYDRAAYKFEGGLERYTMSFLFRQSGWAIC